MTLDKFKWFLEIVKKCLKMQWAQKVYDPVGNGGFIKIQKVIWIWKKI